MGKLSSIGNKVTTLDTKKTAEFSIDRITGRPLQRIRRRIAVRDLCTCRMCGCVTSKFEIDHIVPLFAGGPDSDGNRQLLCVECHKAKTLEDEKMKGRL